MRLSRYIVKSSSNLLLRDPRAPTERETGRVQLRLRVSVDGVRVPTLVGLLVAEKDPTEVGTLTPFARLVQKPFPEVVHCAVQSVAQRNRRFPSKKVLRASYIGLALPRIILRQRADFYLERHIADTRDLFS